MGLDMYAYRLKQEAAPEKQVDVDVLGSAFKHMNVEVTALTEEQEADREAVNAYRNKIREAVEQAKKQDVYDGDFAYWRKFNHLHGWMEKLYREKGGESESFNCCSVRLMPEDLDRLEQEASGLEAKEGFFFGHYGPMDADDVLEVVTFVNKARDAIKAGYAVYYDSWW